MTDYQSAPPLILLAESEAGLRQMMLNHLKQEGYLVIAAKSGQEAIHFLEKTHPDLILLAGETSIAETCERIRQMPGGSQTPLLVYGNAVSTQQVIAYGGTNHLSQPLDTDALSTAVKQLLPKRSMSFFWEITDRKTAIEALTAEHKLLRTLIDNLPDYIFVKDMEGRFIISNLANARYMGVDDPDEVIGKTDYNFFPKERADAFRMDEESILATRRPMLNHEVAVYHEETDSHHWYALTKVPVYDAHEGIIGIVGLIRDITRRKEAEQRMQEVNDQLSEVNNLKSHFLLSISHELRTPLNSIIGYTDMMLEEILGPLNDLQRDRMQRVARNGQHLLALIEDVLTLSSIQTGTMELEPIIINLDEALAGIMPKFHAQAEAKDLMLVTDIEPTLPAIFSDSKSIQKILNNLISNAIKFTPNGHVVVGAQYIPPGINLPIEVDRTQEWVMLYVQDTGIGITTEVKRRLFDEFFRQADGSTTREHGGTGLGLALCKKLVDLMGGHIWLESTPGYGSTFFVLMPTAS